MKNLPRVFSKMYRKMYPPRPARKAWLKVVFRREWDSIKDRVALADKLRAELATLDEELRPAIERLQVLQDMMNRDTVATAAVLGG